MKILHTVEFYFPSIGGAQEVVRNLSEELSRRGHSVTVASTKLPERRSKKNGVKIEEFEISGNQVLGFKGEVNRYKEFLLDGGFDVMMNYAAQQWATDLAFECLSSVRCGRVLAPCGFSGLHDRRYHSYFARIPEILRQYDYLVFHSNSYRDIAFARENGLENYGVIPNGASRSEFEKRDQAFRTRHGIPEDIPMLLTVGSHTGLKGHDLVLKAFRRARIGPAALVVIGNKFGGRSCFYSCERSAKLVKLLSRGQKKVFLLDPPRAEVIAAYHAADLFVFGSKLECSPLVLFEAMASKTAFITTACGNADEVAEWTGGGLVIPSRKLADGTVAGAPAEMSKAIEDLIFDTGKRGALAESGYHAWQERFSWERIAEEYEKVYAEVATRRIS